MRRGNAILLTSVLRGANPLLFIFTISLFLMNIAVIGAGVSGMSLAHMLAAGHKVTVFEKATRPGGLIKCTYVDGVLYHTVGGHVFNSKRADVLDWFWARFDRENNFHKATRHAVVSLGDGTLVDYPIENHLYQMPSPMRQAVIGDLLDIQKAGYGSPSNFEEFLQTRFGKTLYELYFAPYNSKIWGGRSLREIPLGWLAGKLPMPSVREIMEANIGREGETAMVHSSFWYPLKGGSQFLADSLSAGLDIRYGCDVGKMELHDGHWIINGESFERVFYTGNARELPGVVGGELDLQEHAAAVEQLEFHGTTSVLCEVDENAYSWIYMPSLEHESHRIICTGNFSPNNDSSSRSTATIEFSRQMDREEIEAQLARIPFHPTYLAHHWEPCSYPVQTGSTRGIIEGLKASLHPHGFYLLGRFAEWEYYNMDAAMGAALDLVSSLGENL